MTRPPAIRDVAAMFAALALAMIAIAWAAPPLPFATDRTRYEDTAARTIVPDCFDIHCFRVLVPWVLGPLPGSSVGKWKAYAVLANWLAGVGVYLLSRRWGLGSRGALFAATMSALGFGSLYTLYDPFTSDPLMYALGPWLTWLVLRDRIAIAAVGAAIGVLAKEFAAAPMLMASAAAAFGRRFDRALRILAGANIALIAWLCLQLTLVIAFNYGYGGNSSTHILAGGYLATWLGQTSPIVAALALFGEFGVLWLLAPIGYRAASAEMRHFALAAVPVALIFGYVQQPDRAFWNLHFVVTPLAALVLDRAPAVMAWSCIGLFAAANLRLGAQLPFVPGARGSLMASAVLAAMCIFLQRRTLVPAPTT